jgi:WD40 repeat protein
LDFIIMSNPTASPMHTPGTTATGAAAATSSGNNNNNNKNTTTLDMSRSASTTPPPSSTAAAQKYSVTDQAVLEYLKAKGMGSAVLELQAHLEEETNNESGTATTPPPTTTATSSSSLKAQLEADDDQARNQRLVLTKATGGGFGYDLDAAVPIIQWGVPDTAAAPGATLGVQEAKAYLDAFCSLQLWVLTLPDDSLGRTTTTTSAGTTTTATTTIQASPNVNAITKAKQLVAQGLEDPTKKVSLATLMRELSQPNGTSGGDGPSSSSPSPSSSLYPRASSLPPSAKPELLAVTFALLVHTYCELLEVGMETTAHVLRDAFAPIYEPLYGDSLKDLYNCYTTEDMVKLNTHNSQHMESLQQLKAILLQIASLELRRDEVAQAKIKPEQQGAQTAKIQEYTQTIAILQQKYSELSKKASQAFDRMYDLPFLRRARAVRWQLTLSNATYALLAQFLTSRSLQDSLLSISTLLQTKCELHVERRDPLPLTPSVVLDDNRDKHHTDLNETALVNWAAPIPVECIGETTDMERPFPPYHLKDEYEDERSARRDKRSVEFNRALLINGFRRLEALERKREFDTMIQPESKEDGTTPTATPSSPNYSRMADPLEPSILLSTLCANTTPEIPKNKRRSNSVDRHGVSATTATGIPSSSAGSSNRKVTMSASLWEEAGIGLTCAKLSPPDGRRVAVGCDDAAVRVWDMTRKDDGMAREVCQVLLGHKNGFPVFDLSWNRDGRCLLSCGGDGSVRLWDTMAQGPFGDVTKDVASSNVSTPKKATVLTNATAKDALVKATVALEKAKASPDMSVPGLKPDTSPYQSGAALAVYRGHAPNTPVWSVAFAPSGYYFASAGGDATARLWVTDRPTPVRLFAGHTSDSVHCVTFHPNTNYILTGAEDKTARLWDIQTGRCVRLLNGCSSGIHKVQIDPSGQYAAGADAAGIVHLWDLGTGKKVTEFRAPSMGFESTTSRKATQPSSWGMLHAMSFSACGRALATGGDDQCVRIWDIQSAVTAKNSVVETPRNSFQTRRTMLMDLEFTKRNLLLSVGKYISAVPIVNDVSE